VQERKKKKERKEKDKGSKKGRKINMTRKQGDTSILMICPGRDSDTMPFK
jgi:hypothetical protein